MRPALCVVLTAALLRTAYAYAWPGVSSVFRTHYRALPCLYRNRVHEGDYSLEHVVPQSILRSYGKETVCDPYNLHVASRSCNNMRSNYRFLLRDTGESDSRVYHSARLFVPRPVDWGPIVRAVMYCHTRYGIDCEAVVVGGLPVVSHYCSVLPYSAQEISHAILCKRIERGGRFENGPFRWVHKGPGNRCNRKFRPLCDR